MHDEYDILRQVIPAPACALHFSNPFELLIATVLSAQTTDKRVNTVTPELFATFPTARDLAAANPAQVEDIIHPLGFCRGSAAKPRTSCSATRSISPDSRSIRM